MKTRDIHKQIMFSDWSTESTATINAKQSTNVHENKGLYLYAYS